MVSVPNLNITSATTAASSTSSPSSSSSNCYHTITPTVAVATAAAAAAAASLPFPTTTATTTANSNVAVNSNGGGGGGGGGSSINPPYYSTQRATHISEYNPGCYVSSSHFKGGGGGVGGGGGGSIGGINGGGSQPSVPFNDTDFFKQYYGHGGQSESVYSQKPVSGVNLFNNLYSTNSYFTSPHAQFKGNYYHYITKF